MDVWVNGEQQELQTGITLADWLQQTGLSSKHIVVELNERILQREEWVATMLQQGDHLEMITFVGGG